MTLEGILPVIEQSHRKLAADGRSPVPDDLESFGNDGASDEALEDAEERLGLELPPAYRHFLSLTNGWYQLNPHFGRLFAAEELRWLEETDPDWIDSFPVPEGEVSPEEHRTYGDEQRLSRFRRDYLRRTLQIGELDQGAVYLLNPEVRTEDGEWEAWAFASWYPGAVRYRSFWRLVKSEFEDLQGEVRRLESRFDADELIEEARPRLRELVHQEGCSPADACLQYFKEKSTEGDERFQAWLDQGGTEPVLRALESAVDELE